MTTSTAWSTVSHHPVLSTSSRPWPPWHKHVCFGWAPTSPAKLACLSRSRPQVIPEKRKWSWILLPLSESHLGVPDTMTGTVTVATATGPTVCSSAKWGFPPTSSWVAHPTQQRGRAGDLGRKCWHSLTKFFFKSTNFCELNIDAEIPLGGYQILSSFEEQRKALERTQVT